MSELKTISPVRVLMDIDWSFVNAAGNAKTPFTFNCRKYHWYPATFIPEIPYTLIEVLSEPEDVVLDPFAGIGTTAFQALMLGRKPYAVDINRVAVELARSFWRALSIPCRLAVASQKCLDLVSSAPDEPPDALEVGLLKPWYSATAFAGLCRLTNAWRMASEPERSLMFVCLSSTLKAVSAQDRGWGCIADNVKPKPHQKKKQKDAISFFKRQLLTLVRDLSVAREHLPLYSQELLQHSLPERHLLWSNVLQGIGLEPNSVDLVVTSPPYPNMSDYSLAQRLSYYLLGLVPEQDLEGEIGARRKRWRQDRLSAYCRQMDEALRGIARTLRPGGYFCLVLPDFRRDKDDARRRAVQSCCLSLEDSGLAPKGEFERVLPSRRRHHNQRWTTLEKERIYVYEKVGGERCL